MYGPEHHVILADISTSTTPTDQSLAGLPRKLILTAADNLPRPHPSPEHLAFTVPQRRMRLNNLPPPVPRFLTMSAGPRTIHSGLRHPVNTTSATSSLHCGASCFTGDYAPTCKYHQDNAHERATAATRHLYDARS